LNQWYFRLGEDMPRPAKSLQDASFLAAALEGLELQRRRIEEQIEQVRAMLGGRKVRLAGGVPANKPARKRLLSPEARKRIAMAQKRRWAEYRKKQAAQAKAD
jgi:hypothetical protein